ncbi:HoxN/HupN/NixA family nickel/cobalt transporter [Smaragdicoccus niigatensis]|uniref:HoxN/HupN/NixA family nickel/cobalt transporter n=1 Tax=Smaragdicoccus niigatensis TaxID=359359 RepID=UPI0009DBD25E|nr:nickel transporter [Smaragdicoccus niigatensis]
MWLTVVLLHLVGLGGLLVLERPGALGIGLGLTAYTLGLRHAFDADHIAAIDNATRRLVRPTVKPVSVGMWFALGHSTVVVILVALTAIGVGATDVIDPDSPLQRAAGMLGPTVSGVFLVVIGLLNLASLVRILRARSDAELLDRELDSRGFLNRVLRPLMNVVRKPWHMYPVGFLFGLGFDTVTEIGLLATAGTAAGKGLPWYSILVLPILFSAGMVLFDVLDSSLMARVYGSAFARPGRKLTYNVAVTGLSVAVALVIGVQEIVSVVGPLGWTTHIDFGESGVLIAALFAATWILTLAIQPMRKELK